jgi:hypothetical protein
MNSILLLVIPLVFLLSSCDESESLRIDAKFQSGELVFYFDYLDSKPITDLLVWEKKSNETLWSTKFARFNGDSIIYGGLSESVLYDNKPVRVTTLSPKVGRPQLPKTGTEFIVRTKLINGSSFKYVAFLFIIESDLTVVSKGLIKHYVEP